MNKSQTYLSRKDMTRYPGLALLTTTRCGNSNLMESSKVRSSLNDQILQRQTLRSFDTCSVITAAYGKCVQSERACFCSIVVEQNS